MSGCFMDEIAEYDVDVVIPLYNCERYVEVAVASVQTQTFSPKSIIVVDDGSSDRSANIVQRLMAVDPRIKYMAQPNKGVSAARNAGIRLSTSGFVAFLDADDRWGPTKLEQQMKLFAAGPPDLGFVHSSCEFIDQGGIAIKRLPVWAPKCKGDIFDRLLLEGNIVSGSASAVVARRDVLNQAGYFDEELFYGEDWDLWLRLARISKIDFVDSVVVAIRVHSDSAHRRTLPDKGIKFFKQLVLVYTKWQDFDTSTSCLMRSMRRQAIIHSLSLVAKPRGLLRYYNQVRSLDKTFGQRIFRSYSDFLMSLLFFIAGGVSRRLIRKFRFHLFG